jgi:hypothetical protein
MRLQGELKREAVRWAWKEIVGRHEVLRARFPQREGVPVQEIGRVEEWGMEEEDLRGWGEAGGEGREEEVRKRVQAEAEEPFDLARGPLLRVKLLQLGEQEHVLLVNMHHIVSDGWSVGILEREFAALYQAYGTGQPAGLSELAVQYADYSIWQREWLQGEVLEKQVGYWKKNLAGLEALEMPTDHGRKGVVKEAGGVVRWELTEELSGKLKELGRGAGATLFMVLLAGWQMVLGKYSGQKDVAVGTPMAGRRWRETEELVGLFVNTLVLRTELNWEESTGEMLGRG